MPKVSILVPTYNQENYLREALDSLINQTFKDIEILCINDGSTDSTPQILEEYRFKDERIKVINKANSGYGATMNIGLDNATGDYIGILEPDDFVKDTMFEDLYNLADKNNLDMVKSDFYYYTTSNKSARQAGLIKKKNTNKILSVKDDIFMLKLPPSIWSAIYKRSFLNENNVRFLETAGASFQDTSFAFKTLATAKRLMFTSKPYVYYRQDNENSSIHRKDKVYKQYKQKQAEDKLKLGSAWKNGEYLFKHDDGQDLHPTRPYKWFMNFLKRHNLSKITFHELRHTNASLLIANGVDAVTLSKRLGHADKTVTLNTYSHAIQSKETQAATTMDNIYSTLKRRCL